MKRLTVLIFSVFAFVCLMATAQVGAQQTECDGVSLTHRLVLGWGGRVLPGDPNNVRAEASRDSQLLGQIPGGAAFNVLEGPVCADGLLWWRVDYQGLVGWTPQGDDSSDWIEAIVPTMAPTEWVEREYGADFDLYEVSFSAAALFDRVSAGRFGVRYTAPYDYDAGSPAHRVYELGDYGGGQLTVYPVRDMEAYYGIMPASVSTLAQVLEAAPAPADLPALHEHDRYIALADYIQFENGTGYRYITSAAADDATTGYARNLYRFYGLTSDGQFYIELYAPINFPITSNPSDYAADVPVEDLAEFETTALNNLINDPTLVRPSLTQMDALVSSINIQDAAQAVSPVTQATPTPLPPTATPLPPTQTPMPTATPDGCYLTARAAVNLRSGPDVNFPVVQVLETGETVRAIQRYSAGDGFVIYETEAHAFVHEDFTSESPLCSSLPLVEQ